MGPVEALLVMAFSFIVGLLASKRDRLPSDRVWCFSGTGQWDEK